MIIKNQEWLREEVKKVGLKHSKEVKVMSFPQHESSHFSAQPFLGFSVISNFKMKKFSHKRMK